MAPERKRPTRSQQYQHLLVEKAFSHEMLEGFSDDESMYKKLNPFNYDERILVLEDQLKERFWEIINANLTERQLEIVNLLKSGATQSETAKKLGVNQCVAYNTIIHLSSYNNITISEIYDKWNYNSNIMQNLDIKCVNEITKEIIKTKIVNVIKNPPKQLIKLKTVSGMSIRTSADHKFFTNYGWKTLQEAIYLKASFGFDGNNNILEFDEMSEWKFDNIEETYDLEVAGQWHNFIANNLMISNSSITKSIHGNVDYSSPINGGKTSYGGVVKKLNRIIENDPIIKEIKNKISEIRNSSWI